MVLSAGAQLAQILSCGALLFSQVKIDKPDEQILSTKIDKPLRVDKSVTRLVEEIA